MELGGNAPFIVFDDADLDKAVEGAMISKFRNNGQTCVCANRIYVQSAVYDAFAEKLAVAVGKLTIGDGLEPGISTGPLINMAAVEKVEEHIADALAGGGHIVTGGHRHPLGGTFFEPTVVTGVTPDMKVSTEETFGPLAPLYRFETEEEVDPPRQRHHLRPRQLLLRPRHRPHHPRAGGAGIRHGRRQFRPHLHRGRPLRRHQAVRSGT